MLEHVILLFVVLGTSVIGCAVIRAQGGSSPALKRAVAELMESIGVFTAFLAVNVALGVAAILVVRLTARVFVSLYVMDDLILIVLSAFQGFVFTLWRRSTRVVARS